MLFNRINEKVMVAAWCSGVLALLASCSNSAAIESLVSADPQLKNTINNNQSRGTEAKVARTKVNDRTSTSDGDISKTQLDGQASSSNSSTNNESTATPKSKSEVTLPEDFPQFLPLYPQGKLEKVKPGTNTTEGGAVWRSPDQTSLVASYYQKELKGDGWKIIKPFTVNEERNETKTIAIKENLQVTIAIAKSTNDNSKLTIFYQPVRQNVVQSETLPTTDLSQSPANNNQLNQIDSDKTVASNSDKPSQPKAKSKSSSRANFSDFDEIPAQLRKYVQDVAALGILTPYRQNGNPDPSKFSPNEPITRGEYASWLIAANNLYYGDSPGDKIHIANKSNQAAFQDINPSNPYFGAIQGLAEAGLIPSMLTDDSSKLLFQPNAPLKREDLIAWKVPLDLRKALPAASTQAIQDSWGFQDAASIDPAVLKPLFGDFQNGDLANIKRIFGYTTLFQPKKPVTRAEAAASLWYFGFQGDGITAPEALSLKEN